VFTRDGNFKNTFFLLRRMSCPISGLLAFIFLMTSIHPYHSVVGVQPHHCNTEKWKENYSISLIL
jgi:hypothetical protein